MHTLLAVTAHPDDEAFGISGTLARYHAAGFRTALICATRGEAGQTGGLADGPEALAAVRSDELRCSAGQIGVEELYLLDYPDGGGAEWDLAALAGQIRAIAAAVRAEVVVTFDEFGVTRHPDHVAVHRAVCAALDGAGDRLEVRRLFHQVVPCSERFAAENPDFVCAPRDELDVIVEVAPFEARKRAALRCHRTQAADTEWMLSEPEGSLVEESYILAWASDGWTPQVGETDLFAGLS